MTMTVFERIARERILPVVTLDHADEALLVADALRAGGIGAVEITLRTRAAIPAIERVVADTDLLVGAGTVRTVRDIELVARAGAAFTVAPGLDDEVLRAAAHRGMPILPGIATPTEAQRALRAGLRHVKVFPAGALGGPGYLRQIAQPYPELAFLPSGGITLDAAPDYLAIPSVFAVSGSWMLPRSAVQARDHAAIETLAREASQRLRPEAADT